VKRVLMALGLVLMGLGIFLFEADRNSSELPNIPIYPNAQVSQNKVNENAAGTEADPIATISFVTTDTPGEVEGFYRLALAETGWQYDKCCRSYRHTRSNPRYFGTYLASVATRNLTTGGTEVTVKVTHDKIACDCYPD
jgi:hypothetical protein